MDCKKLRKFSHKVADQTNTVSEFNTGHQWSNTVGYGNINISSKGCCDRHPWNRIPPLTFPTSTPVVIKNAWSSK